MSTLGDFGMNEKRPLPNFQDFCSHTILRLCGCIYMLAFGTSNSFLKFLYHVARAQTLTHLFLVLSKWEILKYRIRQFSSHFSKKVAQAMKEKRLCLESEVQKFEKSVSSCSSEDKLKDYKQAKSELEKMYNYIMEGTILRSRTVWYEKGEKSSHYFLTLEKRQKSKSSIRKLNVDGVEVEEQKQVFQCIIIHTYYTYYNTYYNTYCRNLFKRTSNLTIRQCKAFINDIHLSILTSELSDLCKGLLHSSECCQCLISMPSNKTPGHDGITEEFYVAFYQFIDKYFIDSANYSFRVGELSPSQKQAVITLFERKDKDKRLIKKWRPISLLNVDAKIISKVLATRLEKVISFLVTSDQTAYITGRFIGESVCLIFDISDYTDAAHLEGYIFAADMEKAFDSVNHNFIIVALEAYGFGPNFFQWVKTLLYDQKSCIMNNGHSTGYFNLERGTRQRDPISVFLFALTIEVLFIMVRSKVNIRGLSIFGNEIKLTACADDTTIFIKDLNSFYHLICVFDQFQNFSSLKLNMEKSEFCGTGMLKGVQVAFCGCKVVDLMRDCIKILGIYFSYNSLLAGAKILWTLSQI